MGLIKVEDTQITLLTLTCITRNGVRVLLLVSPGRVRITHAHLSIFG